MTGVADRFVSEQAGADHTLPLAQKQHAPIDAIIRAVGTDGAERASFHLGAGSCTVGSSPGCDLVISDRSVSRTHLELVLAPEGVKVRDLDSRNGTFFHGQRIERMTLGLGGRLRVGSAELVVEADVNSLHAQADANDAAEYRGIVGRAAPSRQLFALLSRLEGSLATVLVEGESGVGKERVARALRDGSSVAGGPLVIVNCGAFPREIIASELFGHRRGAFSGALEHRSGAFASADGGTLFLDEVGELPLDLQPMLLRAIELGEIRSLGDDVARHVNVRVIAATNRDLETEVSEGRFRHDLFFRLAVVRLLVPSLRARPEDIGPLAQTFAREAGLGQLDETTVAELKARQWRGNVRELKNAIVSYGALGALPGRRSLPPGQVEHSLRGLVDLDQPFTTQKEALLDAFTRLYLQELMARSEGNQSEAARISGLNRTYLGRMLSKLGLVTKRSPNKGRR